MKDFFPLGGGDDNTEQQLATQARILTSERLSLWVHSPMAVSPFPWRTTLTSEGGYPSGLRSAVPEPGRFVSLKKMRKWSTS